MNYYKRDDRIELVAGEEEALIAELEKLIERYKKARHYMSTDISYEIKEKYLKELFTICEKIFVVTGVLGDIKILLEV